MSVLDILHTISSLACMENYKLIRYFIISFLTFTAQYVTSQISIRKCTFQEFKFIQFNFTRQTIRNITFCLKQEHLFHPYLIWIQIRIRQNALRQLHFWCQYEGKFQCARQLYVYCHALICTDHCFVQYSACRYFLCSSHNISRCTFTSMRKFSERIFEV